MQPVQKKVEDGSLSNSRTLKKAQLECHIVVLTNFCLIHKVTVPGISSVVSDSLEGVFS